MLSDLLEVQNTDLLTADFMASTLNVWNSNDNSVCCRQGYSEFKEVEGGEGNHCTVLRAEVDGR